MYSTYWQCCGSGSAWVRIILVTGFASGSAYASNKNQDPHQDPHQNDKLDPEPDPNPHHFADDKPKHVEYEPI
jgi:hypothetical protein